jgi:HupE / UreJ protein
MKQITMGNFFTICLGLLLLAANSAYAHKPSDSYLSLKAEPTHIQAQWDIALRDLDYAIGLDSDGSGELTWGEVRAKHPQIAAYASSRLVITANGKTCPLEVGEQMLDQHSDGTYAVIYFKVACSGLNSVDVNYSLLFDVDQQHKGLLKVTNAKGVVSTAIFSPETAQQVLNLADASRWRQFADYVVHGVWHIWIGFDHILFLISLLLPAVLVFNAHQWAPAPSFRSAAIDVLKIVTAFTIAHSITLSLAALQLISLPSRWVESVIALSVVLVALNNIFPVIRRYRWLIAFVFGLIHGFGFASILADLGLRQGSLVVALVGFNLGVELGQIVIVATFLPLAFALRTTRLYQKLIVFGGSSLIVLLATIWLIERAFEIQLISG